MKLKILIFFLLLPIFSRSQDMIFTWSGPDTVISAEPNKTLLEIFRHNLNAYNKYANKMVLVIPVQFRLFHGMKYYLTGGYIISYKYYSESDSLELGPCCVSKYQVKLKQKEIKELGIDDEDDDLKNEFVPANIKGRIKHLEKVKEKGKRGKS